MAGREEGAHELARVAEGEVAHQIFAGGQLLLADAALVCVCRGRGEQQQPVLREAAAGKARLFEGQIRKGDVDDAVLQHLQKVRRMP